MYIYIYIYVYIWSEVGGIGLGPSFFRFRKAFHGPQFTGTCRKQRVYGFIEFEISYSTVSTVFRQSLIQAQSVQSLNMQVYLNESTFEDSHNFDNDNASYVENGPDSRALNM